MRLLVVVGFALALAGCAGGQDFQRPQVASLTPGTTTEAEVVAAFGPPLEQQQTIAPIPTAEQLADVKSPFGGVPTAGTYRKINYHYKESQAFGVRSFKDLYFIFLDGKLIQYDYASNIPGASSKFDESQIANIKRGVTTRQQVIAMLGEPSGQSVYPMVRDKGVVLLSYTFIDFDNGEMFNRKNDVIVSLLEVLIGADGKVTDFRSKSETKSLPPPAAPAPSFMPIFIPAK